MKKIAAPLHLPEGSVRAVLAILMVGAVAWNVAMGHQLGPEHAALVTLVIRDYFETRRRKGGHDGP